MSVICYTITEWIEEEILEPVENWIQTTETKCSKWPWPLNWLCNLVVILIKVIVWVSKNVLKPITTLICNVISTVIGVIFTITAIPLIFDAIALPLGSTFSLQNWVFYNLFYGTKVIFVDKSPTSSGTFIYTFNCSCKNSGQSKVQVEASNDQEAADKAKIACQEQCDCVVKMDSKVDSVSNPGFFDYTFECTCKGVVSYVHLTLADDDTKAKEVALAQC